MKTQLVPSRDMLTSGKRTKTQLAVAAITETSHLRACLLQFFFLVPLGHWQEPCNLQQQKGLVLSYGQDGVGFLFFFCCHSSSSMTYTLPAKQKFHYYPQYSLSLASLILRFQASFIVISCFEGVTRRDHTNFDDTASLLSSTIKECVTLYRIFFFNKQTIKVLKQYSKGSYIKNK